MAVGDIIEVVCKVRGPSGEIMLTRFHYVQSSGGGDPSISEMDAIAVDFNAVLAGPIVNVLSLDATYGQTEVKMKTGNANSRFSVTAASGGTSGNSSGTTGGIERALVVRKHTGVAGRRNQGRNFFCMPCFEMFDAEGNYVLSNPDAAAVAALITALLQTVNSTIGGASGSWNMCIWHPAILTYTVVLSATVSSLVGVQRRRRIGVGN